MNDAPVTSRWRSVTLGIIILGVLTILLAISAPPIFVNRHRISPWNSCINNLRMIDSAKESWALAKQKTNGEDAVTSEVNQYIKGNTTPICPQGGTYSYNPVGIHPTCTITNPTIHRLPKSE